MSDIEEKAFKRALNAYLENTEYQEELRAMFRAGAEWQVEKDADLTKRPNGLEESFSEWLSRSPYAMAKSSTVAGLAKAFAAGRKQGWACDGINRNAIISVLAPWGKGFELEESDYQRGYATACQDLWKRIEDGDFSISAD